MRCMCVCDILTGKYIRVYTVVIAIIRLRIVSNNMAILLF